MFALSKFDQEIENRPKPFHFAIVDEVDSVLIDEGRNPLLISGQVIYFLCMWCVDSSIIAINGNYNYVKAFR